MRYSFTHAPHWTWLRRIVYFARRHRPHRRRVNVLGTSRPQRALLSYITYPFSRPNAYLHTQYLEAHAMAAALDDLGFQVDVVDLDDPRRFDLGKYRLIVGLGFPLVHAFRNRPHGAKVVLYSPGAHNYVQNLATLKRAAEFQQRHGVWLMESCRFVESDVTSVAAVCDAVLALGNAFVRESYTRFTDRPVHLLPAPCFHVCDAQAILRTKDWTTCRRHFLWFGGNGLIHKGLDLVLEAFAELPDLHLHVCAPLHRETTFSACLQPLLANRPNIHVHGYVGLESRAFADLMRQCAFAVYASCSEGGSPAVLNVMANGGLIPLVTRSSSIDTTDVGVTLPDGTPESIRRAAREASQWPAETLARRAAAAAAVTAERHTGKAFRAAFHAALSSVLEANDA